MKTKLLSLLLLCACPAMYAQYSYYAERQYKPYDRYWQMDFSLGANLDLAHSSSHPDAYILDSRKNDAAPFFAFRVNHLFSRRIGWYANVQINFHKEKSFRGRSRLDEGIEEFFDHFVPGISWWRPSLDLGFQYRIEGKKWKLHPWAGVGVQYYMNGHSTRGTVTHGDEIISLYRFKQEPSKLFLSLGATVNYSLSNRSYLLFRAGFRQPLQKTSVELERIENSEVKENRSYSTWTAGRNLDLSLGYGFQFGKRLKK